MKVTHWQRATISLLMIFVFCTGGVLAQKKAFTVFGYYAGPANLVDSFPVEKITHLSFSFTHLKGSFISLSNARDSASLEACVRMKKRNPHLKVIVSMG
jgi:chitinase